MNYFQNDFEIKIRNGVPESRIVVEESTILKVIHSIESDDGKIGYYYDLKKYLDYIVDYLYDLKIVYWYDLSNLTYSFVLQGSIISICQFTKILNRIFENAIGDNNENSRYLKQLEINIYSIYLLSKQKAFLLIKK